jgi:dihydroxyacetone kinase-like predicted kinase
MTMSTTYLSDGTVITPTQKIADMRKRFKRVKRTLKELKAAVKGERDGSVVYWTGILATAVGDLMHTVLDKQGLRYIAMEGAASVKEEEKTLDYLEQSAAK